MTNRQASAAKTLLGWSPEQLAQRSNVPVSSVYLLMRLGSAGTDHDRLIKAAFEREGISFFNPSKNKSNAAISPPKLYEDLPN